MDCGKWLDTGANDGKTDYAHSIDIDDNGVVWVSGRGHVRGFWTGGPHVNPVDRKVETASPCDPIPYAGGGTNEGNRAEGGYQGQAFDEDLYVETIPPVFEYVRSKVGFAPKLLHDVHSHLTASNAILFSKKMEPYHLYFVEDLLGPEHLEWYHEVRKVCATPQAVGEVFSNPAEYYPLISARLIDFIRTRVTAIGGITQAKKIANLCEVFGVKTAFQEGGENDPVNQLAAYHVDISSSAFGIQEETIFVGVRK